MLLKKATDYMKKSKSFQDRIKEEREAKCITAKASIAESERRCEETESN